MQDRTEDTEVAYVAPAIERREDVKGQLTAVKGSYCPPGHDN